MLGQTFALCPYQRGTPQPAPDYLHMHGTRKGRGVSK